MFTIIDKNGAEIDTLDNLKDAELAKAVLEDNLPGFWCDIIDFLGYNHKV